VRRRKKGRLRGALSPHIITDAVFCLSVKQTNNISAQPLSFSDISLRKSIEDIPYSPSPFHAVMWGRYLVGRRNMDMAVSLDRLGRLMSRIETG